MALKAPPTGPIYASGEIADFPRSNIDDNEVVAMATVTESAVRSPIGRPGAGRGANIGRLVVGAYFVLGAMFNAVVTYPDATAVYEAFAELSWPVFDSFVRLVVLPLAQPVTLLVIAFEFAVGSLIISRSRWTRRAIQAAVTWHVALIPFLSFYAIVNIVVAAAIALLLRRDYAPRTDA